MKNEPITVEKRPLSFPLFSLRLLSGFIGGISGTLALFVVYFILISLVPSGEVTTISVFVMIIMTFVGTLTANTITAVMVTFMDNEKYNRRKTIITHVFLFNLILFFLTIPLYFAGIAFDVAAGVVALHFLLSAYVSALIMEILAGYQYSLVGVYSMSMGIFISIGIAFIMLATGVDQTTLIFVAMPAVWLMLEIVGGFSEFIYDQFIKAYGVDALSTATDLGGDTEVESDKDEDDDENDE